MIYASVCSEISKEEEENALTENNKNLQNPLRALGAMLLAQIATKTCL